MFITVGPNEKAVSGPGGGEREKGGHVLRDTTSRGLCVRYYIASREANIYYIASREAVLASREAI